MRLTLTVDSLMKWFTMAHKIPLHLREHLEANPQIKRVFFNSKGEWVFTISKHFLDEKTREQVLKMDVEKNPTLSKEQIEINKLSNQ